MGNEVRDALMNNNTSFLCSNYNLLPFQSESLARNFKNLRDEAYRDIVVNRIVTNEYSSQIKVKKMAKRYIENIMMSGGIQAISFLCSVCGYSEEEARKFVERYSSEKNALDSMLSMEIDVAIPNKNIILNSMIEEIIPSFLKSEESKKLESEENKTL